MGSRTFIIRRCDHSKTVSGRRLTFEDRTSVGLGLPHSPGHRVSTAAMDRFRLELVEPSLAEFIESSTNSRSDRSRRGWLSTTPVITAVVAEVSVPPVRIVGAVIRHTWKQSLPLRTGLVVIDGRAPGSVVKAIRRKVMVQAVASVSTSGGENAGLNTDEKTNLQIGPQNG